MANSIDGWNPEAPLERIKGERVDANQALHDYALMGAGRSLAKLCNYYNGRGQAVGRPLAQSGGGAAPAGTTPPAQPPTKRLPTLETWSVRYDWQRRVAAWHALQNAKDQEKWEERRREWRERAFRLAELMAEKAELMLKVPIVQHVTQANGVTIIEPADWSFNTVPQMAAVSDKLARLAAEMPTDRQRKISWQDDVIQLIRDGVVTRADVEQELGHELAAQLFATAGIRSGENGKD